MFNVARRIALSFLIAASAAAAATIGIEAQGVKITDPTSVVMIVNRDSNDIGFMDIKTNKMISNVFLGNNVNPHMVMMSPDGGMSTGGTRANKVHHRHRTLQLVKSFRPTSRPSTSLRRQPLVLPGQPGRRLISVIDMQSLSKIKTIPGFVELLERDKFTADVSKARRELRAHWVGVIDVRGDCSRRSRSASSLPCRSSIPGSTWAKSRASTSQPPRSTDAICTSPIATSPSSESSTPARTR
jgi:hypothetical protein